jgi:hypothetical protein
MWMLSSKRNQMVNFCSQYLYCCLHIGWGRFRSATSRTFSAEPSGRFTQSWAQNRCTALPRVKFSSNPRRIHSEEEDEEKEERGLPRAPVCCSTTFPFPSPSPPHIHRAPAGSPGAALSGHIPPPSKYIHTGHNQWFSGKAAKKHDSLFLETQEWYGWIRTAFVILYKLEWKW